MFDGQLIGVDVGGTKVAVATLEGGRLSDSMVRPTDMTSADGLMLAGLELSEEERDSTQAPQELEAA